MAMSSAGKSRTGPRIGQFPPLAVSEAVPRGGAAQVANHLGDKRRQRGVVGKVVCVVGATAPPGVSLAHEPLTMRVNPATRTSTPRYAPGRRCRACHRIHVRGEERRQLALGAVSHAIRLNELSTVSANVAIPTIWLRGAARCRGELHATFVESSPGGSHALPLIAPPVAQPLTPPVAPPVARPVAPPVAQPLARQWRASGLTRWIPSPQTTCPSPTATDQGTTHRHAMKQPPPTPTFPY